MTSLHLRFTSNSQECRLSRSITPDRLTLSAYSVQMAAAHAKSALDVDISWLRTGFYNSTTNSQRLTLPLDVEKRYTFQNLWLECTTAGEGVPVVSAVRIYDVGTSTLSTGVEEVNLFFAYQE